jgi:hypothetical protein
MSSTSSSNQTLDATQRMVHFGNDTQYHRAVASSTPSSLDATIKKQNQTRAIMDARTAYVSAYEHYNPKNKNTAVSLYESMIRLVRLHAAVEPESDRNYSAMLQYLMIIAMIYKDAVDYPKNLGASKDIIGEDHAFPYTDLCDLLALCFEKVNRIAANTICSKL